MANLADGTTWDETVPVIGSDRRDGHQEILGLRKGTRIRLAYEHETLAASSAGGEHKKGSAKAYHDTDTAEPTQRPDGSTNLDINDDGRLWIDSTTGEVIKVWDGATLAWIQVSGTKMIAGTETVAGIVAAPVTVTVGFIPDLFWFMWGTTTYNWMLASIASLDPTTLHWTSTASAVFMKFGVVDTDDIEITLVSQTNSAFSNATNTFWRALKF